MTVEIAVVIPAYNRADMVGRAVLSALAQTRRPAEVLVVDDGSSDDTATVAERCGARVVRQQNTGHSGARNRGVAESAAPWVAFLDSDDEWMPHHLETLAAAVEREPDLILVGANARAVPSGRLVGHPDREPLLLDVTRLVWPESPLSPSAAMVRRDVLVDAGGFPTAALGEDRLAWIRIVSRGKGMVLPQVTALYHEHTSQVSSDAQAMRDARHRILDDLVATSVVADEVAVKIGHVAEWDSIRERSTGVRQLREVIGLLAQKHAPSALGRTLLYRARLRSRSGL